MGTHGHGRGLVNSVAIVTGGAGELGAQICAALAAAGAKVVVCYHRSAESAQEVVARLGTGNAIAVQADLTSQDAPGTVLVSALNAFGPPTILVNNAGLMTDSPAESLGDETWKQSLEINLTASFRMAREITPWLKKSRCGRIINVSSQAAYRGSAEHAHYASAKAGLLGLTFSLARELGPYAVTVNAVVPGRFATRMLQARMPERESEWLRQTPLGRLGQPSELAAVVAFLASPEASYVTGSAIHVGGGLVMG